MSHIINPYTVIICFLIAQAMVKKVALLNVAPVFVDAGIFLVFYPLLLLWLIWLGFWSRRWTVWSAVGFVFFAKLVLLHQLGPLTGFCWAEPFTPSVRAVLKAVYGPFAPAAVTSLLPWFLETPLEDLCLYGRGAVLHLDVCGLALGESVPYLFGLRQAGLDSPTGLFIGFVAPGELLYSLMSYFTYWWVFSMAAGPITTLVTLGVFVLGRVDAGASAGYFLGLIPDWVNWFIDFKVYGLIAGVVGTFLMRLLAGGSLARRDNLATLVVVTSLLGLGLVLLDSLYFWIALAVPFSMMLTILLVFGPLLFMVNVVTIYRLGMALLLASWGIRDPYVDPGVLGVLLRRVQVGLGPAGALVLDTWAQLLKGLFWVPLRFALDVVVGFFLPPQLSWLVGHRRHAFTTRLIWSVGFFFFALLDAEVLIYIIIGLGAFLLVNGMWLLTAVFGVETVLDGLVPMVLGFWTDAGIFVGFLAGDALLYLVSRAIERHRVRFTTVIAGTAVVVDDAASFMAAPPAIRRDIILGYLSLAGFGRLFVGLLIGTTFFFISWLIIFAVEFKTRAVRLVSHVFYSVGFAMIPLALPEGVIDLMDTGYEHLSLLLVPLTNVFWYEGWRWIRLSWFALNWVRFEAGPSLGAEPLTFTPKISALFQEHILSLTRRSVLRFTEALNGVRLPEFVSNVYEPPSIESIHRAYQMLEDVGFPVTRQFLDELTALKGGIGDLTTNSYLAEHGSWRKWFLGKINLGLGYPKLKVASHDWVPTSLAEAFPGYLHVARWTGEEPEVRSTARYWTGNETNEIPGGAEPLIEDLWSAVRVQFANSRLATFQEVYKGWVKRYNMGFGFLKTLDGRVKQLTRAEVIQMMGGKWRFLEAWEKVFNRGAGLHMPAPVFAKYESLKPKKALERSVRTILGSPFIHHVMTTVFNYHPNHNYKVWETPMKVGMPINGQNYNRLWESLLRHECIWAGDMTAFDSTQSPAVLRVCAAIRKAGYSLHKDRNEICELIDISYESLIQQPLGFKNTGDLAWKNQGATTGHSSTSADNSLMLVANYLYAWRRITGLRAREFFNYNTLANFGDDHVLGYDPVFGWEPSRIIAALSELGTQMRDEAPGVRRREQLGQPFKGVSISERDEVKVDSFSFLAKYPILLTGEVKAELAAAGVTVPLTFATAHHKGRLLGKANGEQLIARVRDPVKSYTALVSYIYMTAHHRDVYLELVNQARNMWQEHAHVWEAAGLINRPNRKDRLPAPPTYNQVLRQWYSKEPFPFDPEAHEKEEEDTFYVHLQDDVLGVVIRWFADVPTLLSPRYLNTRWADWLQGKLSWALSWPVTFVAQANGVLQDGAVAKVLIAKTPYGFLRNDALVPDSSSSYGVNLVRHWVYIFLTRALGVKRSMSVLDIVRLLDAGWANLVFIATGRVSTAVLELDLHVVDTLLVLLCSYIDVDIGFVPIDFDLLTPSLVFARLMSAGLRFITPAGAIDYQPLDAQIRELIRSPDRSFILAAPTGTGKSTRMMARLRMLLPRNLRVVVVEPRHLVTVSVGQYMQKVYPNTGIGISTEGFTLDGTEGLVYATAQSFIASAKLRSDRNVVVVMDEAHVDEPHYIVLRKMLMADKQRRKIFVTATPTDDLLDSGLDSMAVPAVSQNTVHESEVLVVDPGGYERAVLRFVNDRLPVEKILVFVPTKKMAFRLSGKTINKVCVLSSDNPVVDDTASVFYSTSVADAGLTIPDVSFVFSMDYDVTVTYPDFSAAELVNSAQYKDALFPDRAPHSPLEEVSRAYNYRLPEQTRLQRRGRTGRTLDGFFYYYRVQDVKVEPLVYSLSDFANGCRPAARFCTPYFPGAAIAKNPMIRPFFAVWDDVPRTTYARFVRWFEEYRKYSPQGRANDFRDWLKANMDNIRTITARGQFAALDADSLPETWAPHLEDDGVPVWRPWRLQPQQSLGQVADRFAH